MSFTRRAMAGSSAFERIAAACNDANLSIEALSRGVTDDPYRRLIETGLNENQIKLIERFPPDESAFVADTLVELRRRGLVDAIDYPEHALAEFRDRVARSVAHDSRLTYIFPEEARFLFALAFLRAPRRVAFMGSFYGYWATWALPGITAAGGNATLLDTDSSCMSLALSNFERLGFAECVEGFTEDATRFMRESDERFDLIVIDAEGPKSGLPYDETDKAIYAPMAAAALERLAPDGLLLCHNILLSHPDDDPYFTNMVRNNQRQFYKLTPLLAAACSQCVEIPSTEGMGLYAR